MEDMKKTINLLLGKLGDWCLFNDDCMVVINNSECAYDKCKCDVGFIANGTTTCREGRWYGQLPT